MQSKLKIAYLNQQTGIQLNDRLGAVIHLRAILDNLKKKGHDVAYLSPDQRSGHIFIQDNIGQVREADLKITYAEDKNPFWAGERLVRRLQSQLGIPYFALFDSLRFYEACCRNMADREVFHERFGMLGIGGTWAARRMRKAIVLEVNADYLNEIDFFGKRITGSLRQAVARTSQYCYRYATLIVAVSNELKNFLVDQRNVLERKIFVLPNGAETDHFYPEMLPLDAKQKLELPQKPSIVFVGGFHPWHACDDLIESFLRLQSRNPEVILYLIGDGPLLNELKSYVQLNGIANIVFVGAIEHQKIPLWLAAGDVLVSPFKSFSPGKGGSPLKLFEYMAAGRAIVASNTGQVPEILENEKDGLIVQPGDIEGFFIALNRLFENANMRDCLGRRAREKVVERYSWDAHVQKLIEIYWEAIQLNAHSYHK